MFVRLVCVARLLAENSQEDNADSDNLKPKDKTANKNHLVIPLCLGNLSGLLPVNPKCYSDVCPGCVSFPVAYAIRSDG